MATLRRRGPGYGAGRRSRRPLRGDRCTSEFYRALDACSVRSSEV